MRKVSPDDRNNNDDAGKKLRRVESRLNVGRVHHPNGTITRGQGGVFAMDVSAFHRYFAGTGGAH